MLCWGMTGTVMMMCCAARAVAIGLADAVRRWSGAVEKRRGGGEGVCHPMFVCCCVCGMVGSLARNSMRYQKTLDQQKGFACYV